MTSLEILMRCGWDAADALEITKGRRRIMVEPTLPLADANERKYRGKNIPTEDWMMRTFDVIVVDGEEVFVDVEPCEIKEWMGVGQPVAEW